MYPQDTPKSKLRPEKTAKSAEVKRGLVTPHEVRPRFDEELVAKKARTAKRFSQAWEIKREGYVFLGIVPLLK